MGRGYSGGSTHEVGRHDLVDGALVGDKGVVEHAGEADHGQAAVLDLRRLPASGNDQKVRKRRTSRAKLSCNTRERAQRARKKTTVGVRKRDAEESTRVRLTWREGGKRDRQQQGRRGAMAIIARRGLVDSSPSAADWIHLDFVFCMYKRKNEHIMCEKRQRHAPCSRRGMRGSCPCQGDQSRGCRRRAGRRTPSRRRRTQQRQ